MRLFIILFATILLGQEAVPTTETDIKKRETILTPALIKALGLPFDVTWTTISFWLRVEDPKVTSFCVDAEWTANGKEDKGTKCCPTHPKYESLISFQVFADNAKIIKYTVRKQFEIDFPVEYTYASKE